LWRFIWQLEDRTCRSIFIKKHIKYVYKFYSYKNSFQTSALSSVNCRIESDTIFLTIQYLRIDEALVFLDYNSLSFSNLKLSVLTLDLRLSYLEHVLKPTLRRYSLNFHHFSCYRFFENYFACTVCVFLKFLTLSYHSSSIELLTSISRDLSQDKCSKLCCK
jgi:hypothetical protein